MVGRKFVLAAALAAAAAASAAPARAETRKFTIISASPITVTPTTITKEYFVPEINRRLAASGKDFKIEWTESYGPQLAKFTEVLENVEEGIAHFGVLLRNFEESKLPLEQYPSFIPFGIIEPKTMYAVDSRVRAQVPEMAAMYLKYGQIQIARANSVTPHMFTNFPIKTVDDMKGHKIGTSGSLGHILFGTGAVLVTANMAQSYVDIKNGVYDGYAISETNAYPYRTFEVAPYLTKTYFGVTNTPCIVANKKTWDSLPDFARAIIQQVADGWGAEHWKLDEKRIVEFTDTMVKRGVKIYDMPFAERQRWAKVMPNIAKDWAAEMDKKGLPGSRILTAYMNEVRATGQPVVRHWDRD
jgi:TRAP-type C4-dicarboxylate transport system substrate-binding protein